MIRKGRAGVGAIATLLLGALLLAPGRVEAVPARIILLRHGEKGGPWQLCATGRERAQALVSYFIGKGAQKSVFRPGERPKAILAISLHTLESIDPVARSWGQPVVFYSVMPQPHGDGFSLSQEMLHQRNREAARDILEKPEWAGQTLLMNWEHDHIAKTPLDVHLPAAVQAQETARGHAAPQEGITLYDLLHLNELPEVPYDWPHATYDYIWIIDFDQTTGKPVSFRMVKEEFGPPFNTLPQNDWGTPEPLPPDNGCTP